MVGSQRDAELRAAARERKEDESRTRRVECDSKSYHDGNLGGGPSCRFLFLATLAVILALVCLVTVTVTLVLGAKNSTMQVFLIIGIVSGAFSVGAFCMLIFD